MMRNEEENEYNVTVGLGWVGGKEENQIRSYGREEGALVVAVGWETAPYTRSDMIDNGFVFSFI